jgi:hypothetical protein
MRSQGIRRRRTIFLTGLIACLLLALLDGAGTASASAGLQGAADNLLGDTAVAEVVFQHPPYTGEPFGPNGWSIGQCWIETKDPNDPNQTICHYGRGASVVLVRQATAKQARSFVGREIHRGYRRLRIAKGVLAGIASTSGEGAAILAVGRTVAIFTLGASSDDMPNPSFNDLELWLKHGAKKIAQGLSRPGCPAHPVACELP